MTTFAQVIPDALRVIESFPKAATIPRLCLVRDIRGCVRLAISDDPSNISSGIERSLEATLGGYFKAPILGASQNVEQNRLSKALFDAAGNRWPETWPDSWLKDDDEVRLDTEGRWSGLERTITKDAWLNASEEKPWPLLTHTPPIVTFHSFKGGVGRTTLVAAHAIRLAVQSKKRVAVIDLDLEAPGIGQLLGVTTERGVLDVLIDHLALGSIDIRHASSRVVGLPAGSGDLVVFPASAPKDPSYLSKLARLDYSAADTKGVSPVGTSLRLLLKTIKKSNDYILLDSRAGLHDLAGLSLHGLAHVDVIAFRRNQQNIDGLSLTLRRLSKQSTRLALVETMAPSSARSGRDRPPTDSSTTRPAGSREHHEVANPSAPITPDAQVANVAHQDATRELLYDLFNEVYYAGREEVPQMLDAGSEHDPELVRRKDWLEAVDEVVSLVPRILEDDDLVAVSQLIEERCRVVVVAEDQSESAVDDDQLERRQDENR